MIYNGNCRDYGLKIEVTYNGLQWEAKAWYSAFKPMEILLDRRIQSRSAVESWAIAFADDEMFSLKFI